MDLVPLVEGLLARALQDPCPDTGEKGLMALVSGEALGNARPVTNPAQSSR